MYAAVECQVPLRKQARFRFVSRHTGVEEPPVPSLVTRTVLQWKALTWAVPGPFPSRGRSWRTTQRPIEPLHQLLQGRSRRRWVTQTVPLISACRTRPRSGEGCNRGDPAKHAADEDWQTALPDCRLHGRRAGSPGSTSRSVHRICHPKMNGWRACPARGARMTLDWRKPAGVGGTPIRSQGRRCSSLARGPQGSRVGARERHQSSGIVSQGTCLHDLLSCRNPEDRSRRCGECLFARPLRGPSGRRRDGLGKGHRPPAPGTGFGGYRRSSP